MGRWIRRGVVLLVGLLALLAVVVVVRRHLLAERLVEAAARLSVPRERPVHRPPAVGESYEACLGPLLDAAPDAGAFDFRAPEEVREEISRVMDGDAGVETLRAATREELQRLSPWIDAVVACTAAPATGEAPGLGPFADWSHPRQAKVHLPPHFAAKVTSLRVLEDVQRGDSASGLSACADALALERDTAHDKGLVGAMLAASTSRRLVQACGKALDAAPPSSKRGFIDEVGRVRAGLPHFSEILAVEGVEMQLASFGRYLTAAQRARLPENARALASAHPVSDRTFGQSLAWYLYWPAYVEKNAALASAARSATSDADMEAVEAGRDILEWLATDGDRSTFAMFKRRFDDVGSVLDLLESGARVELGDAPLHTVTRADHDGAVRLSVTWSDGHTGFIVVHPDPAGTP